METDTTYTDLLKEIPPVPEGATFTIQKIEKVTMPHPYCITSKHVVVASDHHSGILNEAAIEDAEKRGAHCGMRGCRIPYAEHVTSLTLFVAVPDNNGDLNKITGLGQYLCSIKPTLERLKIEGIAFPNHAGKE